MSNMPSSKVANAIDSVGTVASIVVEWLAKRGIRATWEFPGYLHVRVPGEADLLYGTVNGCWDGHRIEYPSGDVPDGPVPRELPLSVGPIVVARVIGAWYDALHTPCEHGYVWHEHCPAGCPDIDASGKILAPPRAIGPSGYQEVATTFRVLVYFRPPKKGEIGYWVDADATPERALAAILADRQDMETGAYGFGWVADCDKVEFADGDRCVTITVEERDVRAGKAVLL